MKNRPSERQVVGTVREVVVTEVADTARRRGVNGTSMSSTCSESFSRHLKLSALLAATIVSCGSAVVRPAPRNVAPAPAASQTANPVPVPLVDLTVSEDPIADRWLVAYHFAHPVMGVSFARGHDNHLRSKSWAAVADCGKRAVSWRVVRGHEAVFASGQEPFQDLVLSFPTDASLGQSGYLLNASFSDGGRLFLTGDFAVTLLTCPHANSSVAVPCNPALVSSPSALSVSDMRWTFRTSKERHILVFESRAKGELVWTPTTGSPSQGTYAYFGDIEPRDTALGRTILDPGLPAWMLASVVTYVPRMLEWFAKDTGVLLSVKPLVFVTYDARGPGLSEQGSGLPGVVQLAVSGDGWAKNDDAARVAWLGFLGHELFHIWNSDMAGPGDPWLMEGSSDWFETRALLELGVIDRARWQREVIKASNACMMMLGRHALLGFPNGPEYPCGATLLAWADGIAQGHGKTVGSVLGAVFAQAQQRPDHRYGTKDFLDALAKVDPDPKRLEPFERVLRSGVTEHADELYQRELSRPDFAVTLGPVTDADVDHEKAYKQVGVELARCDCNHRINLWSRDTGTDFGDSPECSVLKNVRVVAVEGHPIPKDALAAYRAILERRADKPIALTLDGNKPLALTCRKDADMPPFQRLLR